MTESAGPGALMEAPTGPASQPPPPRRSRWIYVLWGCGGCALLLLVVLVVIGVSIGNAMNDAAKHVGPINPTAIQQRLGEVPLYPKGELDVEATRQAAISGQFSSDLTKRLSGRSVEGAGSSTAVVKTKDSRDTVLQYYDKQLTGAGWQRSSRGAMKFMGMEQRAYERGNEIVIVQAQSFKVRSEETTMITLMRMNREARMRSRRFRNR